MKYLVMLAIAFSGCTSPEKYNIKPTLKEVHSKRDVVVKLKTFDKTYYLVSKKEQDKLLKYFASALRDNAFLNREIRLFNGSATQEHTQEHTKEHTKEHAKG